MQIDELFQMRKLKTFAQRRAKWRAASVSCRYLDFCKKKCIVLAILLYSQTGNNYKEVAWEKVTGNFFWLTFRKTVATEYNFCKVKDL